MATKTQQHKDEILRIIDDHGNLIGIVWHDTNRRCREFYKVNSMDMDEIKALLDRNALKVGGEDKEEGLELVGGKVPTNDRIRHTLIEEK